MFGGKKKRGKKHAARMIMAAAFVTPAVLVFPAAHHVVHATPFIMEITANPGEFVQVELGDLSELISPPFIVISDRPDVAEVTGINNQTLQLYAVKSGTANIVIHAANGTLSQTELKISLTVTANDSGAVPAVTIRSNVSESGSFDMTEAAANRSGIFYLIPQQSVNSTDMNKSVLESIVRQRLGMKFKLIDSAARSLDISGMNSGKYKVYFANGNGTVSAVSSEVFLLNAAEMRNKLDMNHDGEIHIDDVVSYLHKYNGQVAFMDLDQDGVVDTKDVRILLQFIDRVYYGIPGNHAPFVTSSIDQADLDMGNSLDVSLTQLFHDEDGDLLQYTYSSSDESIVKIALFDDDILHLTAMQSGTATITIRAIDKKGDSATEAFNIHVRINQAPAASNVSITGSTEVGGMLTGIYEYMDAENDAEGESTFQWYVGDDVSGVNKMPIAGATGKTLTISQALLGKYVFFEVTPKALTGTSAGIAVMSAGYEYALDMIDQALVSSNTENINPDIFHAAGIIGIDDDNLIPMLRILTEYRSIAGSRLTADQIQGKLTNFNSQWNYLVDSIRTAQWDYLLPVPYFYEIVGLQGIDESNRIVIGKVLQEYIASMGQSNPTFKPTWKEFSNVIETTRPDAHNCSITWVQGIDGSKKATLTISVKNSANQRLKGYDPAAFSVTIEGVNHLVTLNDPNWFGYMNMDSNGDYVVDFNGTADGATYSLTYLQVDHVVIANSLSINMPPADLTPPVLSTYTIQTLPFQHGGQITMNAGSSKFGTIYYIVQETGLSGVPTASQVKDGLNVNGVPAAAAGTTPVLSENSGQSFFADNLTPGVSYTAYFVFYNLSGIPSVVYPSETVTPLTDLGHVNKFGETNNLFWADQKAFQAVLPFADESNQEAVQEAVRKAWTTIGDNLTQEQMLSAVALNFINRAALSSNWGGIDVKMFGYANIEYVTSAHLPALQSAVAAARSTGTGDDLTASQIQRIIALKRINIAISSEDWTELELDKSAVFALAGVEFMVDDNNWQSVIFTLNSQWTGTDLTAQDIDFALAPL